MFDEDMTIGQKIKMVLKMPYFWVFVGCIALTGFIIYKNEVSPRGSISESFSQWVNQISTGVQSGFPSTGLDKQSIEDAVKDEGASQEELDMLHAILNGKDIDEDE